MNFRPLPKYSLRKEFSGKKGKITENKPSNNRDLIRCHFTRNTFSTRGKVCKS